MRYRYKRALVIVFGQHPQAILLSPTTKTRDKTLRVRASTQVQTRQCDRRELRNATRMNGDYVAKNAFRDVSRRDRIPARKGHDIDKSCLLRPSRGDSVR
jgi:hypothetical protein